jgi:hypothetical protein
LPSTGAIDERQVDAVGEAALVIPDQARRARIPQVDAVALAVLLELGTRPRVAVRDQQAVRALGVDSVEHVAQRRR